MCSFRYVSDISGYIAFYYQIPGHNRNRGYHRQENALFLLGSFLQSVPMNAVLIRESMALPKTLGHSQLLEFNYVNTSFYSQGPGSFETIEMLLSFLDHPEYEVGFFTIILL